MIAIPGISLPCLPISGLQRLRDLEYFEGPLLTHFVHPHGDHFLYSWVDCDDNSNRWMVIRVSETNILRLMHRTVPLDFVIPRQCQDDFAYFVDLDESGKSIGSSMCALTEVPDEYLPHSGSYLPQSDLPTMPDGLAVMIEGEWSVEDLAKFPRLVTQVYSLLYGLTVLRLPEFEGDPWRGGFRTVRFYEWARRRIPAEHRPSVAKIQYASPGFIEFRLHGPSGMLVEKCLLDCKQDSATSDAYLALMSFIREHQLNEIATARDQRWAQHEPQLHELTARLIAGFSVIDAKSYFATCTRAFEAAKIAASFYHRIKELMDFEKRQLVQF